MQTVWLAPWMQFRCSNREKYKILTRDDFESRNYSKCFTRFRALGLFLSFSVPLATSSLSYSAVTTGQFLFQAICKWTFHKILSRDRYKGETSRFLNLYGHCSFTIFPLTTYQRSTNSVYTDNFTIRNTIEVKWHAFDLHSEIIRK